jgi:hypothetical protein
MLEASFELEISFGDVLVRLLLNWKKGKISPTKGKLQRAGLMEFDII